MINDKDMQYRLTIEKGFSDVMKFVAAVTVMLHHYSQYVCANHISDNIIYTIFSSQGGYLGVAMFFLLSGYGLMESDLKRHLSPRQFVGRRLLKVYLPVVLVTALWLTLYYHYVAAADTVNYRGGVFVDNQ